MGRELMRIELFDETVRGCSEALRPLGVDPYSLIMRGDPEVFKNTMHCMVCITAIQVSERRSLWFEIFMKIMGSAKTMVLYQKANIFNQHYSIH